MLWPSLYALVLAAVGWKLVAADLGNFINPPLNNDSLPVWTLGETQVITWNSSFSPCNVGYSLTDWAYNIFFAFGVTNSTVDWTVNVANSTLTNYTSLYFLIVQSSVNDSQSFLSTPLNVDAPSPQGAVSTTISLTSDLAVITKSAVPLTSLITSTTSTTSVPIAASTFTAIPTDTPTPSPSLSGGAIAGIAIGNIAGLCALGALAFLLFGFRKRRRLLRRSTPMAELDSQGGGGGGGNAVVEKRMAELSPGDDSPRINTFVTPAEMQASMSVHELLGSQSSPQELDASEAGDLEDPAAAMLGHTVEGNSRRQNRLAGETDEQRSPRTPMSAVSRQSDGARSSNPVPGSETISPVVLGSGVMSNGNGNGHVGWR